MFESLPLAPPDAILGLMDAFKRDPNPNKINLSVGVYKDETGNTPILQCVKEAERRLLASENSKGYLSIEGHAEYDRLVPELLFGRGHEVLQSKRAVTAQTPGGTGSLRVAADFLKKHFPTAKVWVSKPTWANHAAIFTAAGQQVEQYAYIDASGRSLDFAAMKTALALIFRRIVCAMCGCPPTSFVSWSSSNAGALISFASAFNFFNACFAASRIRNRQASSCRSDCHA